MLDRTVFNRDGEVVREDVLRKFADSVQGEIVRPGDEGYETGRRVWNGMIDKFPAMIVYCTGPEHVVTAVNFARENNLLVAVRSGGHNVAGNAVCDGGLVIDLSRMKGIYLDAESRVARAAAGLTWGEFDYATQAYGLATTGGLVSSTGIAGLTLGGGIGWLMRKHGLTCDNLLSVDLVTANGQLLTANTSENADLFWGVRGGGGNFGIVTTFTYRLHRIRQVMAGMIVYPADRAAELLRFYRDHIATVPDELTTMFVFLTVQTAPYLSEHLKGRPAVAIYVCYAGPENRGQQFMKPLRDICRPLADAVAIMPYVAFQSMLDVNARAGLQNYWKSAYLGKLTDACIDTIANQASGMTSPLTQVHIQHMQGAVSRMPEDATAFSATEMPCAASTSSPSGQIQMNLGKHITWTRAYAEAMMPFSQGVYVNFLGDEGDDRVKSAYRPETYKRLVTLKKRYDPDNFFRLNQNIRPSGPDQ